VEAKYRILFADDASMFRELSSLFLARLGSVITVRDGLEALDAIRRQRPHVVVADMGMPRMGGEALCKTVKADPRLRDIPIVLVTPGKSGEDRARAVLAGADDVIAKPLDRISFIQVVNRFLRSPRFRGLARIPVDTTVRMHVDHTDAVGSARNLSRGGMFVEADYTAPPDTRLDLQFRLPGVRRPIASTAKVVWRRDGSSAHTGGMGVQFLTLDRPCMRSIEDFIYENRGPDAFGAAESPARP
jgi:uncharacterized protein (TIGR02266 family)